MSLKLRKCVLFDLDGTLCDSSDGIFNGIRYAMAKMGFEELSIETLNKFIGPPLTYSFMTYASLSEADAEQTIELYREYYRDTGIFENRMYDGIKSTLESLKAAGKRIFLATSKPEVFARRILVHFELDGLFEYMAGASFDKTRHTKAAVIEYLLNECNISADDAVMVGDRHHDVEGAAEFGIPTVGVLYGFGDKDELISAGAAAVVETTEDLSKILI